MNVRCPSSSVRAGARQGRVSVRLCMHDLRALQTRVLQRIARRASPIRSVRSVAQLTRAILDR